MKKSNSKTNSTIINYNAFNAAFRSIKNEQLNLKGTMRAIVEAAATNKDAKQIATWLQLSAASLSGKAWNDYRNAIVSKFVYYTEGESVKPCTLVKVCDITTKNGVKAVFKASECSYLQAVKQIANRANRQLPDVHNKVELNVYFDRDLNVIDSESELNAIAEALDVKKREALTKRFDNAAKALQEAEAAK